MLPQYFNYFTIQQNAEILRKGYGIYSENEAGIFKKDVPD